MTIAVKPKEAKPIGVPGLPRPQRPAHVIRSDQEAIEVAKALAKDFAATASERDRARAKPIAELDAFSQSGLWSINVPKAFGGPEVSYVDLRQGDRDHLGRRSEHRPDSAEPSRRRRRDPHRLGAEAAT